ncbi:LuxR C-terminal-related transcriptional regulator [Streptomyces sp. PTM05]|uniref:LuxR C-terminal-related transcriptional regulator n=1 Tax=Streptantibioticus parmotrematis TaxID=2873249 RepID=A0ABS7QYX5_9ACTN|nr:LuxR family transcriptional regulator [Streptantibioticus parmotrematis]MBY8886982.1 LuxR C-terminal-related transcriptional regulator [Streptantibioticus parmotrematis]
MSVLIGRLVELGVIEGLLGDLQSDQGRSLLIEGEPGIGKSTLLSSVLSRAAERGCEVRSATCDEENRQFQLSRVSRVLGFDEAYRDAAPPEPAGLGDPVAARVERFLTLVDRMCVERPLVLGIEDLESADDDSLLLWRRLCRATAQLPLLLVGTARPESRRSALEQLRREVRGQRGVQLRLGPLGPQETARMVAEETGSPPGPRLIGRLESAAGNPFYIKELLAALVREGQISRREGTTELVDEQGAPAGSVVDGPLAVLVSSRVDFLTSETRATLRLAALLGPRFTVAELVSLEGSTPGTVLGSVEEALDAGVLEPVGPALRFRHGLLREALSADLSVTERDELRRRAAQALITAGAAVETVARVILPALATADGWELDWLTRNVSRLADRVPAVAVELLEHALPHTSADDPRHALLESQLVGVCFLLNRFSRVEELCRGILARTSDPHRIGQARWLLGITALRGGRYTQVLIEVDAAIRDPRLDAMWRARHSALRALALCFTGGPEAAGEATRVLALGEELGDPTTMGYALHAASVLSSRAGDRTASLAGIDRALAAIGTEPALIDLRLGLLGNRTSTLDDLGRYREAAETMALALGLAERVGAPRLSALLVQNASRCYTAGRWDDALAELGQVEQLPPGLRLIQHGVAALIEMRRSQWREASHRLAQLDGVEVPPGWPSSGGNLLVARSLAASRAGRPHDGMRILAVLLSREYERNMETRSDWLPDLVRLALAAGDTGTAWAAAAAAARDAEHEPLPGKRAAAEWCRGLANADPAAVLAAADLHRSAGRVPDLGAALEDAAVLQAQSGDRQTACGTLGEALAVYHDLGATWDSRRATERLRFLGVRASGRRRPKTGWDSLTATESRVASLVAEGRSNPDIAERLLLSRRTVETHVSHILAKLSATSRKEIRDMAAGRDQ